MNWEEIIPARCEKCGCEYNRVFDINSDRLASVHPTSLCIDSGRQIIESKISRELIFDSAN